MAFGKAFGDLLDEGLVVDIHVASLIVVRVAVVTVLGRSRSENVMVIETVKVLKGTSG